MAAPQKTATRRPINVATAKGSGAERFFRERGGLPGVEEIEPEAIAPGVRRSPRHDLRFHGGKIIPDLTYTNFYVGGAALGFKATFRISIKYWRRRCRIHT